MAPDELTVYGKLYVFCFGCVFLYTLYCVLRGWYLMFKSFSLLIKIQNRQGASPHDAVASGELPAQQTPEFIAHQALIRQSKRSFSLYFCGHSAFWLAA